MRRRSERVRPERLTAAQALAHRRRRAAPRGCRRGPAGRGARRPRGPGRRRWGRRDPARSLSPPGSCTATTPRPTSSRTRGSERVRDVRGRWAAARATATRRAAVSWRTPVGATDARRAGSRHRRDRDGRRRCPAASQGGGAHEERVVVVRPQGDQPAGRCDRRGPPRSASDPPGPGPSRPPRSRCQRRVAQMRRRGHARSRLRWIARPRGPPGGGQGRPRRGGDVRQSVRGSRPRRAASRRRCAPGVSADSTSARRPAATTRPPSDGDRLDPARPMADPRAWRSGP